MQSEGRRAAISREMTRKVCRGSDVRRRPKEGAAQTAEQRAACPGPARHFPAPASRPAPPPFAPSALAPSPSPSPPTLLVACAELCTLIRRIRFHSSHSIYHVAHTTQHVTFDRNCGNSPSQRGQAGSLMQDGSKQTLTRTRRHPGDAQAVVCGRAVGAWSVLGRGGGMGRD